MEGYPDNIGRLGAIGIFKEAGRLVGKHFLLFLPFILAFFVPATLLQVFQLVGMQSYYPGPPQHHHHLLGTALLQTSTTEASEPPLLPPGFLVMVFVFPFLMWLLSSLGLAAFANCVAYVYDDGEAEPSITKKIFKALPRDLLRLLVTSLWLVLFTTLLGLAISVPMGLLVALLKINDPIVRVLIQTVPVYLGLLILQFLFLLAAEVAVLEPEAYGLAAVKKSTKLVKEKIGPALAVLVADLVLGALVGVLVQVFRRADADGNLPKWTVPVIWIAIAVLWLVITVYMLVVNLVLYFSAKAELDARFHTIPQYGHGGSNNPYAALVTAAEQ